jgi:ParB/RepB/Spo0J family partition protein
MQAKPEIIELIPLTSITVDLEWNARSGNLTIDCDPDTGDGFDGLVASIEACGVKEPVKVRPVIDGERPYALVSGFRRYAASLQLKRETVPAVVREMTEAEARLENARENAVRQGLKASDLAWAVGEMVKQGMTDTDIARGIGRSQAYVSQLHRIMELDPKVTAAWRRCPLLIPVDAMYGLFKFPKLEQWDEFRKVLAGKTEDEGRVHKRGRLQALAKRARDFGVTLGTLARLEYVGSVSADFEEMVENVIRIPGTATARHRRALADAMAKGYREGAETPRGDDD